MKTHRRPVQVCQGHQDVAQATRWNIFKVLIDQSHNLLVENVTTGSSGGLLGKVTGYTNMCADVMNYSAYGML